MSGRGGGAISRVPAGVACPELAHQVLPLELELAARLRNAAWQRTGRRDPGRIEPVAPRHRLDVNPPKMRRDRRHGVRRGAKSRELRVARVAACAPAQNRLREQSFSPGRDETGWVEVGGVEAPEPQVRSRARRPPRIRRRNSDRSFFEPRQPFGAPSREDRYEEKSGDREIRRASDECRTEGRGNRAQQRRHQDQNSRI